MQFLTVNTIAVLEKARFAKDTNVPNNHQCFEQEQLQNWVQVAEALGIDFTKTGYTVRVVLGDNGKKLYTPYIGSNGSEPCIFWGNVEQPLSAVDTKKVDISIDGTKVPRGTFLIYDIEETVTFTLMVKRAKEDSETFIKNYHTGKIEDKLTALKTAYRKGTLTQYLAKKFTPAIKLADIAHETVTVIGYKLNQWGNYELSLDDGQVVRGNTQLNNKLATNPEISVEKPATLRVGGSYESNGYTVFEVELKTTLDKELPTFDFGSDIDEVDNEDYNVTDDF